MANWPKFYILIVARIIILLSLLQYFIFSGISNCAYYFAINLFPLQIT